MSAQQKTNEQYTQFCAQYADLGFKIDALVNQRRGVRRQIEALSSSVPFILQAEKDAQTAQLEQATPQVANGKMTDLNGGHPTEVKPN